MIYTGSLIKLADELRRRWGEPGIVAYDWVKNVVTSLGGTVHFAQNLGYDEPQAGAVIIHSTGKFDVYLPAYTSPPRNALLLAKGIAHYLLHFDHGSTDPAVFQRHGTGIQAWQADRFAEALLRSNP